MTVQDPPLTCYVCGTIMVARSCKLRCPNCGQITDCSDGAY